MNYRLEFAVLFLILSQVSTDATTDADYLKRIRKHEDAFSHCQITYDTQSYTYKSVLSGKPENLPTVVSKAILTFRADGIKMRFDHEALLTDGTRESRSMVTSDGERLTSWIRTDTDSAGQGTLHALTEDSGASFPVLQFRPFYKNYICHSDKVTNLTFTQDGDRVIANWHDSNTHRYELVFSEWKEVLRPVTLKSIYLDSNTGKETTPSEMSYFYKSSSEGPDSEWPVKVETILFEHDVCLDLLVEKVNLSPSFTDSTFRIDFPDGTWVTDESTGISQRYYKSGMAPSDKRLSLVPESGSLPPENVSRGEQDLNTAKSKLESLASVSVKGTSQTHLRSIIIVLFSLVLLLCFLLLIIIKKRTTK